MNPGWAEWKNDEYILFQSWYILLNKCWDINVKKRGAEIKIVSVAWKS